jgi:hypothetical protein
MTVSIPFFALIFWLNIFVKSWWKWSGTVDLHLNNSPLLWST